ncbi:MAG: replication-associated recombination protein A, partial [Candidatus Phosphoribacter sp.]
YAAASRVAAAVRTADAAASRGGAGVGVASDEVVYRSPHDAPEGVLAQQYLPDELVGRVDYYRPSGRGFEERLAARWLWLKGVLRR